MDKQKAIALLKQYLSEIPELRDLHYDNQDFELWVSKIGNVIKAALDQEDRRTFASAYPHSIPTRGISPESAFIEHYQVDIAIKETAIKKIIQKYEILGLDKDIATKIGETSITKVERMVTVTTPIQLFDAMQFHPKVVKASKLLFETGNYASAILEAFKAVNIFVKEKSGLSKNALRGVKDRQLMAKVFDEKVPLIKLNELITDTDFNEQEGFKLLFMGATEGIRNPKAHDLIEMKDPYRTLEYLGFASLLMHKISFWKVE